MGKVLIYHLKRTLNSQDDDDDDDDKPFLPFTTASVLCVFYNDLYKNLTDPHEGSEA